MALGPGKYDDLCTYARLKAKARGAILVILGDTGPPGFSVQMPPETLRLLPGLLEFIATTIRGDVIEEDITAAAAQPEKLVTTEEQLQHAAKCKTCYRIMTEENLGGDCDICMAEAGDSGAIKSVLKKYRELIDPAIPEISVLRNP